MAAAECPVREHHDFLASKTLNYKNLHQLHCCNDQRKTRYLLSFFCNVALALYDKSCCLIPKILSQKIILQVRVRPENVARLSCLFSKASSVMEVPLMRLAQAGSPQLEAVSMYYSKALLAFAKKVFQVSMEEDFTCKLEVGNWRRIHLMSAQL